MAKFTVVTAGAKLENGFDSAAWGEKKTPCHAVSLTLDMESLPVKDAIPRPTPASAESATPLHPSDFGIFGWVGKQIVTKPGDSVKSLDKKKPGRPGVVSLD